nr:MAG TPA: hypothetical protein [Caudoviricetes sp.]
MSFFFFNFIIHTQNSFLIYHYKLKLEKIQYKIRKNQVFFENIIDIKLKLIYN